MCHIQNAHKPQRAHTQTQYNNAANVRDYIYFFCSRSRLCAVAEIVCGVRLRGLICVRGFFGVVVDCRNVQPVHRDQIPTQTQSFLSVCAIVPFEHSPPSNNTVNIRGKITSFVHTPLSTSAQVKVLRRARTRSAHVSCFVGHARAPYVSFKPSKSYTHASTALCERNGSSEPNCGRDATYTECVMLLTWPKIDYLVD